MGKNFDDDETGKLYWCLLSYYGERNYYLRTNTLVVTRTAEIAAHTGTGPDKQVNGILDPIIIILWELIILFVLVRVVYL